MASAHDQTYDAGIYGKQGGGELHIGNPVSGPDGTGAAVVVAAPTSTGSAAVALALASTQVAGAANVTSVTFQLQDGLGNVLGVPVVFDLWLSDSAVGLGLTAVTASGGISVTTGTQLVAMVASKALRVMTDTNGKAVLQITDTAKTTFYPCCNGGFGQTLVGTRLTAALYG